MSKSYKHLKKEEKNELLKNGLLLTLPISLGIPIVAILLPFFISDAIRAHGTQELINIIGLIVFLIGIYVYANHIQNWFLHQLITNQCKISVSKVIHIKEGKDATTLIRGTTDLSWYRNPSIQVITTEKNNDIPTLYRGIDESLKIGSEVYIVSMKNGEIYALTKKANG